MSLDVTVRLVANLLLTGGYSFRFELWPDPRPVLYPGQTVLFVGRLRNNGLRLGTVYPTVRVASTYDHTRDLFNSDRDLTGNACRALRTVDIPVNGTADFVVTWDLPRSFEAGVYDCSYELWTPRKLFRKVWAIRLARKVRRGCLEVVKGLETSTARPRVFISYCWEEPQHRRWVFELVDQLARHDIEIILDKYRLDIGDDVRGTLESELRSADAVIVVASSAYVARANARIGGVGLETSILADPSYLATSHHKIIPLVRDNALPGEARLPEYLTGTWYLDMDEDRAHWKGQPLSQIIQRVGRLSDRLPQDA